MDKRSRVLTFTLLLLSFLSYGNAGPGDDEEGSLKVVSRSYGTILGLQRGKYTFLDVGFEYHWRKIRLTKPRLYSLGGNFKYNFGHNILGYKFGFWYKPGRISITAGGYLVYYTDFEQHRVGLSPAIGVRLLGFHLINGYNFTVGSEEFKTYNTLYIALRYYFPLENKIKFKKKKK